MEGEDAMEESCVDKLSGISRNRMCGSPGVHWTSLSREEEVKARSLYVFRGKGGDHGE